MEAFLSSLKLKGMQGRKVALVENGTWAPMAAKHMRAVLDTMKNMQDCLQNYIEFLNNAAGAVEHVVTTAANAAR